MVNELVTRDVSAEWSVVGSMLLDERCIPAVLQQMRAEDFSDGNCKLTYLAIQKLALEGKSIDLVTVLNSVSGGADYVRWAKEVLELTPTAANVGAYIDIVQDAAALRRYRNAGAQLYACTNLDDAQAQAREVVSLLSATNRITSMSASELGKTFVARLKGNTRPRLPWGFPTANRVARAHLGDFVLLGGYPSAGKTLVSIQMALAQAKQYRVAYYTLETGFDDMSDRIYSHLSGVPMDRIQDANLGEKEWASLAEAVSRFASESPFDIIEAAGYTVEKIMSDAIGRNAQVIYIDYLQQIKVPGIRLENRYAIVTEISQSLKSFARTHGIAVVALAQLTRPETIGKKSEGKLVPPNMSSFRESGQLEQDADVAFLIWSTDPNDNQAPRRMKLGKNKRGRKFSIELEFMGGTQTMVEVAPPPVSAQYAAEGRAIKQRNRAEAQRRQKMEETKEIDSQMQIFPEDDNPFEPKK